jgi:hypothetical protein
MRRMMIHFTRSIYIYKGKEQQQQDIIIRKEKQ